MIPAFWDASALVPLCVQQRPTAAVLHLLEQYHLVVWWGTVVELQSALERLLRTREISPAERRDAGARLQRLQSVWREVQPSSTLRQKAASLLQQQPLKAADALQLAAAWTWASGAVHDRLFISGDRQLLTAARNAGFTCELV